MTTQPTKTAMTVAGGGALLPIYPQTFEEVARLANMTVIGGMVKAQRFKDGDEWRDEDEHATKARATMIIMQGMELGIPPMQAVQLIAMINGRMTVHSEGVPGLLLTRGFKIAKNWTGTEMADDWTAICTLTRPDGQTFVGKFSVAQAKRAKLWSPQDKITKIGRGGSTYTADNDSPWHKYPDRMLWARALGFAARDGAADAMRGMMVREEMEDMLRGREARDITPPPPAIEHVAKVESPAVPDIPDIPDVPDVPEASDDGGDITDEAERDIRSAVNIEMLAHLRDVYGDADWDRLEPIYDARYAELESGKS